jgi:hypothetical protein
MAAHEFEPARAKRRRPTVPPRTNLVLARTSRRPKTRSSRLLVWVFSGSMLAAAAVLATAAYWGYRHMQPTPLFAPASVSPERSQPVQPPPVAIPVPPPPRARFPAGWN